MLPAVIVPAFSRPHSLRRLLAALARADYPSRNVKIIISLDGGYAAEVEKVAEAFAASFSGAEVSIVRREKNLGLRRHILWCGDQTETHGAVIILEDDLMVDRCFYQYARAALASYSGRPEVAGIALYSPRLNEYAGLPFEPLHDGSTGYFMQVTCSSGQAWTREQWSGFREWYAAVDAAVLNGILRLPAAVKGWSEHSWKKYFCAYLILKEKYFFYPYLAYSTNCSDSGGTHLGEGSSFYQVPLPSQEREGEDFRFPAFGRSSIFYDSYMEPISPAFLQALGLAAEDVEVDLYGIKPLELLKMKPLALTSREAGHCSRVFLSHFRPLENLRFAEIEGRESGRDPVFILAQPESIKSGKQPFYKVAMHFSYFSPLDKRFIVKYMLALAQKLYRLVWKK